MDVRESAGSDDFEVGHGLKAAVLMGGVSRERDVSLESGSCVAQALRDAGLEVVVSDIRPDNLGILEDDSIDVFFIALHGEFGEDGRLQRILENRRLIYTGSGPEASRLAFDKIAGKRAFTEAGVPTPAAIEFASDADGRDLEKQLKAWRAGTLSSRCTRAARLVFPLSMMLPPLWKRHTDAGKNSATVWLSNT